MNEHQRIEEREVRELLAGAGPRPVVPAEDVAAIKAAAREEWRRMAERERRRRGLRARGGLALAASLLVAVVAGWWWSQRSVPAPAPVVASVELLSGGVRVRPPGAGEAAVALAVGGELASGALVETGGWTEGPPVGVALRLAGGESLRLTADTGVRLISERRLELRRGTLYVDSGSSAGAGVEVVTVLGTVRDIGTQFEVRLSEGDAAMRIRVREGECALEASGERHRVSRGEQLSLLGDGSVTRARVEPYGPEWDWVLAMAPRIETEGLPLDVFLTWASRELGRDVRYADPELVRAIPGIVVRGSTEGFTPEEALEWVLRGSDLGYELDDGSILIRAAR